jgi:hypothetical protein
VSHGRLTSAHALAFVALLFAVGGGIAVAGSGSAPKPKRTIAYHYSGSSEIWTQPGGRSNLVAQLVIPAKGLYAVTAKVLLVKGSGTGFSDGTVNCQLGSVGAGDNAAADIAPGGASTLSFSTVGRPAAPLSGGTQAIDLACESSAGSYGVTDVRITALTLDGAKQQ